jgi:hypothetical protein
MVIPDWKTLTKDPAAQILVASILEWAAEYNLQDEWLLDFSLMILMNFKTGFRFRNDEFRDIDSTMKKGSSYALWFDQGIRDALKNSLIDFQLEKITIETFHEAYSGVKVEEFLFQCKDFEFGPTAWFPNLKSRKNFVEETTSKFDRWCKGILELDRYPTLNEEGIRNELEKYCDNIEQKAAERDEDFPVMPFSVGIVFGATWVPCKMSREDFIEMFMDNALQGFEKGKKMALSLKTLDKGEFDSVLSIYCDKIQRKFPKNYGKTPAKYGEVDRDFVWLVDSQVIPAKSFSEIALDYPGTTPDAVKRAVARLCTAVGKTRRTQPKTGRPKGVKEKHPRRRVQKIPRRKARKNRLDQ